MKYKVEEIRIPLINAESMGGKIDYFQGEPEIQIKGYKDRDEIKLVESTEITIQLSGLPKELQDLWQDFKGIVEDWVKEQESK